MSIITHLWLLWATAASFMFILWLAKRRATREAREANQFLRDFGAPTGLKIKRRPF